MGGQYIEPMLDRTSFAVRLRRAACTWPHHAADALPRQCELCRSWSRSALCERCLRQFAAPVPRCETCAIRLTTVGAHCGECLREAPPFERCIAVGDYAFPWDRLISEFKFHARIELAAPLAQALGHALARCGLAGAELVLPVPLGPQRLAERGHNQAWELARRVARTAGIDSDANLLLRLHDTPHQVGLTRAQRERNLRDAMLVDPLRSRRLHGRRVALVDDVLTTGATARVAAQALLQAGAAAVQVWVLARTPRPQDA